MAIQFARLQYVQRSKGQSSCQKAAYNGRAEIHDLRQDKKFDFSNRGDSVYHAVMLPEGVSEKYNDISVLWNTVEVVEFRSDSQVAKEMVLALPNDAVITMQDRIALTRSFLKKHFVDKGIICQVDIHAPHKEGNESKRKTGTTHEDSENWHAHVLMPTRRCNDEIFGLKATDLDVDIRKGRVISTDKQWGSLWADHQNEYFKENEKDLVVDPIGIIPQAYIKTRCKTPYLKSQQRASLQENRRQAQEVELVMQHLLENASDFEKVDVERFAAKHIPNEIDRQNFFGRFWSSDALVLVGEDRYTSKIVLREEQKLIRMADRLANKARYVVTPNYQIDLNAAQKQAVEYVCAGPNLTCIEGRAGTGKSRALCAIRETYEADGKVVRGLAPTSSVANAMKKDDGFAYAANIKKFLFSHNNSKIDMRLGNEVWLVDEAAMVANHVMGELLGTAWKCGAKVVLVGDDKQLPALGRGGAFKACVERFDSRSIDTIIRQRDNTCREIVEKISEGKTTEALFRMAEIGAWTHCRTEQDAVRGLMNAWYENYNKNHNDSFVILDYRNQFVKVFNDNVHTILRLRGDIGPEEVTVRTERYGFCEFSEGEKIIFRSNDTALGVHNGQEGILMSAKKDQFVVRVDDELDITFNPQKYNDFQAGHAITMHCGQGKTVDHSFALHSPHVTQNLFYVANSRHRLSSQYFSCGDRQQVCTDIARVDQQELCPESLTEERRTWLGALVIGIVDHFSKNHEFYNLDRINYREKGLLITKYHEDDRYNERLEGYRTLYTKDQKHWPDLEGQNILMASVHRDLEPLLRAQGVGQCILLDAERKNSQLIGPYDRFHNFYQEHRTELRENNITETQLRVRLFALEQQFKETPHVATEMAQSKAYAQLMDHETSIRPELSKIHNEHVTTQMIYHLEKTGNLPNDKELWHIQQRVYSAIQQFGQHQHDKIFEASIDRESQKQIQFIKQRDIQMQMEM